LNNARKDIEQALEAGYIKLSNDPEPRPKHRFTQADIDAAYLSGREDGYEVGYNDGYDAGYYHRTIG
jgi:hypothetical protein